MKYEDLEGIPCLLILCEKGRFGDTFPHNLRVLDMRLRTANSGTTVIQELGRMCRYPKTNDSISSVVSLLAVEQACSTFSTKFPNGAMVKDKLSEMFLGVAETAVQLRYIFDFSIAKMQSSSWLLLELKYPLPISLMDEETMKMIRTGLDLREQNISEILNVEELADVAKVEDCRNCNRILSYISFNPIDDYLEGGGGKTTLSTEFSLRKKKENEKHYDYNNNTGDNRRIHDRRILISAECQIGKTGCFLAVLQQFATLINISMASAEPALPLISKSIPWFRYLAPYWLDMHLQDAFDYSAPHSGKYIKAIATQRFNCLLASAKRAAYNDGTALSIDVQAFNDCFERLVYQYEFLSSKSGRDHLTTMLTKNRRRCPFAIRDEDKLTLVNDDATLLLSYLNWDGRVNYDGIATNICHEFAKKKHTFEEITDNIDGSVRGVWDHAEISQQGEESIDLLSNQGSSSALSIRNSSVREVSEFIVPTYETNHKYDGNPRNPSSAVSLRGARSILGSIVYNLESDDYLIGHDYATSGKFSGIFRAHMPEAVLLFLKSVDMATMSNTPTFDEVIAKLKSSIQQHGVIKQWMFTISYQGKFGKQFMYLYRKKTFPGLTIWRDFVQVLIVRDNQFTDYREYFGQDYIIISLPDKVEIIANTMNHEFCFTPETAGCGYARLFIQQFAEFASLNEVWMIDDNITSCYRLAPKTGKGLSLSTANIRSNNTDISFENCTFLDVILHIEAVFDASIAGCCLGSEMLFTEAKTQGFKSIEPHYTKTLRSCSNHDKGVFSALNTTTPKTLQDYIGCGSSQYGIIGIARQDHSRQEIKHPVKVTHSVYSFYLFNVKAAKDYKLYYPPRRTMEDIEMNFMMEESGLVVCKMQMFYHRKPPRVISAVGPRKQEEEKYLQIVEILKSFPAPIIALDLTLPDSMPNSLLVECKDCLLTNHNELKIVASEVFLADEQVHIGLTGKEYSIIAFVHDTSNVKNRRRDVRTTWLNMFPRLLDREEREKYFLFVSIEGALEGKGTNIRHLSSLFIENGLQGWQTVPADDDNMMIESNLNFLTSPSPITQQGFNSSQQPHLSSSFPVSAATAIMSVERSSSFISDGSYSPVGKSKKKLLPPSSSSSKQAAVNDLIDLSIDNDEDLREGGEGYDWQNNIKIPSAQKRKLSEVGEDDNFDEDDENGHETAVERSSNQQQPAGAVPKKMTNEQVKLFLEHLQK